MLISGNNSAIRRSSKGRPNRDFFKVRGMAFFLLIFLNLVLLYQDILTIRAGYSISVPEKIFVELNHCIDVPCTFTVPEWYSKSSSPLYIYWFKTSKKRYYMLWINIWVSGELMVTNDLRQKADITDFKLTGDPKKGNCSFSIANAQFEDWGKYYLRIDKGVGFRYAFVSSSSQPHINPQIVVTDIKKKPIIWKPSSFPWGQTVVFSCVASDCCSNPKPQILWSLKPSQWNFSDWAIQQSSWAWTYGTNLSFVPSLANEGLILVCYLMYPATRKHTENAIKLRMAYSPQVMVIHICKYDSNGTTVCSCAFHSWPPPQIQWYLDHQYLIKNTTSDDVNITFSTQGNTGTSSLHLLGNKLKSYLIKCRGINPIGFSSLKTLSLPCKTVKTLQNVQLPAIILGTFVTILLLIAVLYYYSDRLFYVETDRNRKRSSPTIVAPQNEK